MIEPALCNWILADYEKPYSCYSECKKGHCLTDAPSQYTRFLAMYVRDSYLFEKRYDLKFHEFLEWLELRNENRKKITRFSTYEMIKLFSSKKFFTIVLNEQQTIFRELEKKSSNVIDENKSELVVSNSVHVPVSQPDIYVEDSSKTILENLLAWYKEVKDESINVIYGKNLEISFIGEGGHSDVYCVKRLNKKTGKIMVLAMKTFKNLLPVYDDDTKNWTGHSLGVGDDLNDGYNRARLGPPVLEGLITCVHYTENYVLMKKYDCSLRKLGFTLNIEDKIKMAPIIIRQICRGIKLLLAKGYFHNDLKGGNIFVNYNKDYPADHNVLEAVIGDLGSCRKQPMTTLTTTQYASPIIPMNPYSSFTDMYSFGISMIEFLSSDMEREVYKESPQKMPQNFPLKEVILKMISVSYCDVMSVEFVLEKLECYLMKQCDSLRV